MNKPRFVIVNTCDAPCWYHVAEWIEGIGYCYMARSLPKWKHLKTFDGMHPSRPTDVQDFGLAIQVHNGQAVFVIVGESSATYEDGKPRRWQDDAITFTLPLVTGIRKKRKARAA